MRKCIICSEPLPKHARADKKYCTYKGCRYKAYRSKKIHFGNYSDPIQRKDTRGFKAILEITEEDGSVRYSKQNI